VATVFEAGDLAIFFPRLSISVLWVDLARMRHGNW
jgi:hypothetical protein